VDPVVVVVCGAVVTFVVVDGSLELLDGLVVLSFVELVVVAGSLVLLDVLVVASVVIVGDTLVGGSGRWVVVSDAKEAVVDGSFVRLMCFVFEGILV
jgi:hypothetical protein